MRGGDGSAPAEQNGGSVNIFEPILNQPLFLDIAHDNFREAMFNRLAHAARIKPLGAT